MAKKSAAQAKLAPKENVKEKLEPIEDVFEDAKKMFIMTVETQIKTAKRVDNLLNIRDLAINFMGREWLSQLHDQELHYYKILQDLSVETYERILEASKGFELEEFLKPEIKDYYEDIVPKVENIDTIGSLLQAAIVFLSVQPYGNKLIQMHQLIQSELAKRGEL